MHKRLTTIYIDDATIETLRRLAEQRGIVCRTGPGAPTNRGNVSEFLIVLARELSRNSL